MKKLAIMILCVLFALTGCSFPFGSDLERNANHPTQTAQPTLNPQSGNQHQITVPLYFQYSSEGYLSSEIRTISVSDSLSLEAEVLTELIAGPSASSPYLKSVINPNTKVVSVVRSGKYYYVTLTDVFLEPISGLPEGWRENETWAKLVQTSQQLAAYSVIDTLLSLGRGSQVQILIAPDVNSKGERPTRSAMGFSADLTDTRLMEPMTLDLSRVLTPQTTCNIILKAFSDKNWSRIEKFIAQSDPYATSSRPSQTDLVTQLQQLDLTLLDYTQKDVNVSANGQSAVVTVSLALQRTDATKATFTLLPLTFVWENNSWQLCYESLAQLFGESAP